MKKMIGFRFLRIVGFKESNFFAVIEIMGLKVQLGELSFPAWGKET